MKTYKDGGETDPPKKGGTFGTVDVVADKPLEGGSFVETYQWKGNSLNRAINKVDKLIDYNVNTGGRFKSQKEADQFKKDVHEALSRGAFGKIEKMFKGKNFSMPAQGPMGTSSRFGAEDMMSLKLDQGYVKVDPSVIKKTDAGFSMEQLTPEQAAEVKRMQKESGDPEKGMRGNTRTTLLPDGTPAGQFSDEKLSEFAELGAPKDTKAPKSKKGFKPSPEYNAGVKAYQADLRAAKETINNLNQDYRLLSERKKKGEEGQAILAEIKAIKNDRRALGRLGSELTANKGFADYEKLRNEIEFEYASDFFD
jgi:hypothetical protein